MDKITKYLDKLAIDDLNELHGLIEQRIDNYKEKEKIKQLIPKPLINKIKSLVFDSNLDIKNNFDYGTYNEIYCKGCISFTNGIALNLSYIINKRNDWNPTTASICLIKKQKDKPLHINYSIDYDYEKKIWKIKIGNNITELLDSLGLEKNDKNINIVCILVSNLASECEQLCTDGDDVYMGIDCKKKSMYKMINNHVIFELSDSNSDSEID